MKDNILLAIRTLIMWTLPNVGYAETFVVEGNKPLNTNNNFRKMDGNPLMSIWSLKPKDNDQQFKWIDCPGGSYSTGKCLNARYLYKMPWQNRITAPITQIFHGDGWGRQSIDIGLRAGTPVLAPMDSRVIHSNATGVNRNHYAILLQASNGVQYSLIQVTSTPKTVFNGRYFRQGEQIGVIAVNDPRCAISRGVHLHFGLPSLNTTVDGLNLLPQCYYSPIHCGRSCMLFYKWKQPDLSTNWANLRVTVLHIVDAAKKIRRNSSNVNKFLGKLYLWSTQARNEGLIGFNTSLANAIILRLSKLGEVFANMIRYGSKFVSDSVYSETANSQCSIYIG